MVIVAPRGSRLDPFCVDVWAKPAGPGPEALNIM
jgi:hypothetical protein